MKWINRRKVCINLFLMFSFFMASSPVGVIYSEPDEREIKAGQFPSLESDTSQIGNESESSATPILYDEKTEPPYPYGPYRNDSEEGIPAHAYSPFEKIENPEAACPPGGCDYVPDQVLIKFVTKTQVLAPDVKGEWTGDMRLNTELLNQSVINLEPIFPGSVPPPLGAMIVNPKGEEVPVPDLTRWYRANLSSNAEIARVVSELKKVPGIDVVEPNYLRKPTGLPNDDNGNRAQENINDSIPGPTTDPLYDQQWHITASKVPEAWSYLESKGLPPGGNRDVVIAVIDTGVDYTHPDLVNNMWTNPNEIADNGLDDDNNGFIDDVYGANVVSNVHTGDPKDDHGHGTHVAGIIAAEGNNHIGGVGIAFNSRIMAIKAAQYSGVLSVSDIAQGIDYAVKNSADVINMSFGGYARSQLEEDALAIAFGQAVLVASAGNDGKVNLPCTGGANSYPAAYNWVLGVMAYSPNFYLAGFSNYDCEPQDSSEYELAAPGVGIWSTLPDQEYAAWAGTSMAAPVVSGIAALVRTAFPDKDMYSSRFIMGQIATTGTQNVNMGQIITGSKNVTNGAIYSPDAYKALTKFPTPKLSYLEHWLFDTQTQSSENDNDGIADAGETIDLAIVIRNHWGKADPVTVKLEPLAKGAFQTDPYVSMLIDTVDYGAVGSFNVDDNGLIYQNGVITGVNHPFRFTTSTETPNDHLIPFRLTMTAGNGMNPDDLDAPYTFTSYFYLRVQRGRELPNVISEDFSMTSDYYWLINHPVLVKSNATLTIGPGTQVEYTFNQPSNPYAQPSLPYLQVEGTLLIQGSADNPVEMFISEIDRCKEIIPGQAPMCLGVRIRNYGTANMYYARVINPKLGYDNINSIFTYFQVIDHSYISWDSNTWGINANVLSNSRLHGLLYKWGGNAFHINELNSSLLDKIYLTYSSEMALQKVTNTVFLQDNPNNQPLKWVITNPTFDTEDDAKLNDNYRNNAFLSKYWDLNINHWMRIFAGSDSGCYGGIGKYNGLAQDYWGTTSTIIIDAAIHDSKDDFNCPTIVYQPILNQAPENAYPFVVDVILSTDGNTNLTKVGAGPVTFTVTFNRDMNPTVQPLVSFGPDVPETDYTVHPIDGGWKDPRTWEGTFNISPITGDGYQFMRIAGAVAADDPWLVTGDDTERFRFEIITSGTESMDLQASGCEGCVKLTWTKKDFELLSGYNMYRSTSRDGDYQRINHSLVPPQTTTYTDGGLQTGQTYYYKFTYVAGISESDFSNIAEATPVTASPPVIVHTPVTQAQAGQAVKIEAEVTDNVGVESVKLYYRKTGTTSYFMKDMPNTSGNLFSAAIDAAQVTTAGLDYYIEAKDVGSTVYSGTAANPYKIQVINGSVQMKVFLPILIK